MCYIVSMRSFEDDLIFLQDDRSSYSMHSSLNQLAPRTKDNNQPACDDVDG